MAKTSRPRFKASLSLLSLCLTFLPVAEAAEEGSVKVDGDDKNRTLAALAVEGSVEAVEVDGNRGDDGDKNRTTAVDRVD